MGFVGVSSDKGHVASLPYTVPPEEIKTTFFTLCSTHASNKYDENKTLA